MSLALDQLAKFQLWSGLFVWVFSGCVLWRVL